MFHWGGSSIKVIVPRQPRVHILSRFVETTNQRKESEIKVGQPIAMDLPDAATTAMYELNDEEQGDMQGPEESKAVEYTEQEESKADKDKDKDTSAAEATCPAWVI